MTQDEIIDMARQLATQASKVGPYRTWTHEYAMNLIMQLVDASAAKEREACLKICEAQASTNYWEGADVCAEAIRARGQA